MKIKIFLKKLYEQKNGFIYTDNYVFIKLKKMEKMRKL